MGSKGSGRCVLAVMFMGRPEIAEIGDSLGGVCQAGGGGCHQAVPGMRL